MQCHLRLLLFRLVLVDLLCSFDCSCAAVLLTRLLHTHELVHGTVDHALCLALLAVRLSSTRLMMLISAGAGLHVQEGTLVWNGQHLIIIPGS